MSSLANLEFLLSKLEIGSRQQFCFEGLITQIRLDAEHIFQAKWFGPKKFCFCFLLKLEQHMPFIAASSVDVATDGSAR